MPRNLLIAALAAASALVLFVAIRYTRPSPDPIFDKQAIAICGQRYPTTRRVIRWDHPDGFNAYLPHRYYRPDEILPANPALGCDTPHRFTQRDFLADTPQNTQSPDDQLRLLRRHVDLVVIHYDAAGTSRRCFEVLHDERGLSAHFLIDLDGTIFQTLDVRERARHAGSVNDRSVGIEIANLGAYEDHNELQELYNLLYIDSDGRPTTDAPPYEPITGLTQNRRLHQIPFTDAQYDSLAGLIRSLAQALPHIRLTAPRHANGNVLDAALPPDDLDRFRGIVGHHHVTDRKLDPGPAFDWARLLRRLESLDPETPLLGGPPTAN